MGTAGIQKAKVTGVEITTYNSSVIVELKGGETQFTAFIDQTCLGANTKNKETTLNSVKWFLIREHVWKYWQNVHSELGKSEFFEVLKSELRESDYKILVGNHQVITKQMVLGNSPKGNLGVIFMLMPFNNFPEIEIENIFLTALNDPQVLYANFKFQTAGYIPLNDNEKKAAYGQTVDVEVYTHLLPNWRNRVETFEYKVELINRGNIMATSEGNIIKNPGNFNYNSTVVVKFLLEVEWQEQHQNRGGNEEFYLRLSGNESSDGAVIRAPGHRFNSGSYDSQTATEEWNWLEDGKWVFHVSQVLLVPFDTFADLMGNFEIEKKNQIQYIGDIRYTRKEFDPCGFSKITITEDGNAERVPFVIFDENDTTNPIDRTSNAFSIIAGDTRKNVSITLDNLITTETFCQGLLLPAGQKHTSRENVFQVNTVIPALRNSKRNYPTVEDTSQPGDTDVQADNVRGPSKDVSDVQQWVEGRDYNFESSEKIILKLKYNYNKNYETALAKLLGYTVDTAYSLVNTSVKSVAWVSRYIFLLSDYKQIYYLPISTCRYPNQIAKIDVYPDFEWWINFKYNTESPLFVVQSPNYKHRDFTTTDNQSQTVAKDLKKETDDNWKLKEKKYKLDLEAVFKINEEEHPLIPGDGFPILNAIKFFLKAYEIFKQLSFSDETAASEANIARGTARTSEGLPAEKSMTKRYAARKAIGKAFRITVTLPSLSGGIQGKFSQSKVSPNLIGSFYKLEFAAKPLFGVTGELDLLFYAQFIGPIGQAMYRLSQIVRKVNYLTLGAVKIDYYINVGAKVDFNVEFTGVEYHSIDGWDGGELQVYIPIELYLNAGADINASIEGIGTAGIDARIEGKAEFEVRATYDKRENKCPALLKFNGLSAKVWIKFTASETTSNDTGEPEEEPDHILSIIDPKDPWQINIL